MPAILNTLVAVALCAAAYAAGLRTADHYHRQQVKAVDYALERQRMDARAHVTPLSPATPYVPKPDLHVFPNGKHAMH